MIPVADNRFRDIAVIAVSSIAMSSIAVRVAPLAGRRRFVTRGAFDTYQIPGGERLEHARLYYFPLRAPTERPVPER